MRMMCSARGEKMETTVLEVTELGKTYREFALRDVSFSLKAGYIMGLTGRNGAGKTTLIKALMNPKNRSSGRVLLCGVDTAKEPQKTMRQMGVLTEELPFLQGKTLEQNARMVGYFYDAFHMEVFQDYLRRFELNSQSRYDELSRGMRMKFQLAFALSHEPKLLLMDEATGGLDVVFRREFFYMLQEAVEEQMLSVIIATHVTEDLDKVADYVAFLEDGNMKFFEAKEDLNQRYSAYLESVHGVKAGEGNHKLEDMIYHYSRINRGDGYEM